MPATAVGVIASAFLLACALTAAARWLAPRLGFVDRPDGSRKRHARPTPLMGGVAICVAFIVAAALLPALMPKVSVHRYGRTAASENGDRGPACRANVPRSAQTQRASPRFRTASHSAVPSERVLPSIGGSFAALGLSYTTPKASSGTPHEPLSLAGLFPLLASAGLFCLLGLYDDRRGLRPRMKLAGQVAACLPFVFWGETIGKVGLLGIQCSLGVWSVPFTVFWLVACSNVINLMDGMDGLAGTISFIILLTLAAMAALAGRYGVAAVPLVAAASVAGFLVHNWPPAKIFMGDCGSLTLGFLIGALAIQASLKQAAGFMLVVPMVLISVPVFDTGMAILRRKLSGRGIGQADRLHIHHRLQDQGLSRVQSLLLIATLCTAMAGFSVLSSLVNSELPALMLCCSVLAALVIARVFGHEEIDLTLQHLRAIGRLVADTSRTLPFRLLAVRLANMQPEHCDDYWQMMCDRVAQCGGKDMQFRLTDHQEQNVLHCLSWTADEPASPAADTWQVKHTVPRDGGILATLTATGTVGQRQWAAQVNEASQLIFTLCHSWPLDAQRLGAADLDRDLPADVIRFDDSLLQDAQSAAGPAEDTEHGNPQKSQAA